MYIYVSYDASETTLSKDTENTCQTHTNTNQTHWSGSVTYFLVNNPPKNLENACSIHLQTPANHPIQHKTALKFSILTKSITFQCISQFHQSFHLFYSKPARQLQHKELFHTIITIYADRKQAIMPWGLCTSQP